MMTNTATGPGLFKSVLAKTMGQIMNQNDNVVIMGQGVTDPIRIFGTLKGLAEEYPDRVIEMPICEEGMTGVALGASLNGLYPIQTHIRMDFLMLAMNQLVNHVAKYRYMYAGSFEAPMLIRTIVGRSWGQGPQHSQSLQAMFSHIPGLAVIMPSSAQQMEQAYKYAVEKYRGPVLSIEHRWLYDTTFADHGDVGPAPFAARTVQSGSDVTIVATSYMVQEAQRAASWVKEKSGITCDIIDPFIVSDINHDLIFDSVKRTGRLIVADTSYLNYGVAAEVSRGLVERDPSVLKAPPQLLGLKYVPTPTSHQLESLFYPDSGSIVNSIYKLVKGEKHDGALPSEELKKSQWVNFKGPF